MDIVDTLMGALRTGLGLSGAVYAVAGIGLNLHFGYTGLLNFGHAGFLLVGAYGLGVTVDQGGPFLLGVAVGIIACIILALILGIPTLRLRADYLAITTIAASEILRLVTRARTFEDYTGGVFGLNRIADAFYAANPLPDGTYGFGSLTYSHNLAWVILVTWAIAILFAVTLWLLMRSPWGRVIKAIREDEDAARSLGKNVFAYKMQSLVIGGVMGGVAGMMFAIGIQNLRADFFDPLFTFFIYAVVILGGPATIWGPIAGSILFWAIISFSAGFMGDLVDAGVLSSAIFSDQDVGAFRFVVVGLGLMALMVWRPQGLFGRREEMLLDAR
ncbi:MAG: branched-chain amino acid ABC transporter permease [Nitriliruptorales bacterium]|nr:branched-chain amino acid ABC transporter permease [Nitriliruptorales bacterium]